MHDFVCCDVLQAAITSLHEPYFVDAQKDLAGLIAQIIVLDPIVTRSIILSLPGTDENKVDRRLLQIRSSPSERVQRSVVLDLLSNVRGVSIHEQGRIERASIKKAAKPGIKEEYMSIDETPKIVRGGSPGLAGVADMFG